MRLVFIGPPGSGKGTQAKLLSQRQGLVHFATGDILRDAIRGETPEGKLAEPFVHEGQLVPDYIVNEIVASRFRSGDCPSCFVMDGYPRTIQQAETFDQVLKEQGLDLEAVVRLVVEDKEIIRRLSGRWTCPKCKATYQTTSRKSKVLGVCDVCQTRLIQRDDDKEETVAKRLAIFNQMTAALLAYYRPRDIVREVPGLGDVETIH